MQLKDLSLNLLDLILDKLYLDAPKNIFLKELSKKLNG
jgi:hypothetical protein